MKKFIIFSLLLLVLMLTAFFLYLKPNLQVVNGYAAKNLCSCVFVAGIAEEVVKEIDLGLSFINMASTRVDYQDKSATSHFWGLVPRKAVYREGLGCALINELDESTVRNQSFAPSLSPKDSLQNWFELPDSIEVVSEAQAALVQKIINSAFENDPDHRINTRAVVVLYKGRLIGEQYADEVTKDTPLLGWSMTKSVTSTMAGLLIRDGYFALNDPAPVARWKDTEKEGITYKNLLQMSSGLKFDEIYESYSDANQMLWISDSAGMATVGNPLEASPGEKWYYSSGTTNLLMHLIRGYFPDQDTYLDYLNKELFNKIGAYSFIIEPDASGGFVGSSFGWATARDWARLGQLYLNKGVWAEEEVLPAEWVEFVQQEPEDPEAQDTYGGQFWLGNNQPNSPDDAYYMKGFHGQRVMIVPSKELVVVRLGVTYRGGFDFDGFLNQIIDAVASN
ncbi:MAG: serine hydrolase [Bacteroidota bacterium]